MKNSPQKVRHQSPSPLQGLIHLFILFSLILISDGKLYCESLSSKNLESIGLFRVSDFLQYDCHSNYTPDGFFYNFSFNGLNDYQHQDYSVYINGHQLFFDFLGIKNINSLPINLNFIDSIEIIDTPCFYQGKIHDSGLIRIQLQEAAKKTIVKNSLVLGNESKDTGPFRYTKYISPNVDKIGSEFNNTVAFKCFDQSLQFNSHYRQHIFTDWAVRPRISNLAFDRNFPMSIEYGGSMLAEGNFWEGTYSIMASSLYARNFFYFFPIAGYEFPLNYTNSNLGINTTHKLTNSTEFSTNIIYENELCENLLTEGISTDFTGINHLETKFILNHIDHPYIKNYGLSFHFDQYLINIESMEQQIFFPEFFAKLRFPVSFIDELTFSENFQFYNDKLFDSYLLECSKNVFFDSKIYVTIAKKEAIKNLNGFDLWTQSGYILPEINISRNLNRKTPQKYSLDFALESPVTKAIDIKINLFSRLFKNQIYYSQNYLLDDSTYALTADEISFKKGCGIVQGFSADFLFKISRQLQMKVNFRIHNALSDDENFNNVWEQIPTSSMNYNFQYNPTESFSIWINFQHSSATKWMEFYDISGMEIYTTFKENYVYNYKTQPVNLVNLKIRKGILKNRLAMNLFIQNLLDQKIQQYPGGASFDMSMYFGIDFNL